MEHMLGLLKVRVVRGINLAVRDVRSSDPYVVIKMGKQKLKTHVVNKNVNPEWNEELTLSIIDPTLPVKLVVYDKDTFTLDDPMGNAEIDIQPFLEAVKMRLDSVPNNTIVKSVMPNRSNCIAEESKIYFSDGKIFQDVILRLRDVECGEVELRLQWVDIPNCKGL